MSVKTGDEFKVKLEGNAQIFGNGKDNFGTLVLDGSGVNLHGFDKSLQTVYSKEVGFDSRSNYDKNLSVYPLGDKYYWLYSSYDKAKNESYVYSNEINIKEGSVNLSKQPLFVGQPVAGVAASMYKFFARGKDEFTIGTSKTNAYLGIAYIIKPNRDGGTFDHVTIMSHVYEQGFKQVWERKIDVSTTFNAVVIADAVVTENGELYLLLAHESKNVTRALEVLYFKKNEAKPISIKPVFDNFERIIGYKLAEYGKQVAVGGLYRVEKKSDKPDGFYVFNISNNEGKLTTYPIEEALIKRGKSQGDNLKFIDMAEMLSLEDGSLYLSAEVRLAQAGTSSNSYGYNTSYRYGDVYSIRIDSDGKRLWAEKIQKLQFTKEVPDALGIQTIEVKNSVVTLLNDNENNDETGNDDKAKTVSLGAGTAAFATVAVDMEGKKTRAIQDSKLLIVPYTFEKVSSGRYIGLAHTNGRNFTPVLVESR